MHIKLHPEFDVILQPLGSHAAEFFLAASLYHSRKVSFAKDAHMADECVLEDIHTAEEL